MSATNTPRFMHLRYFLSLTLLALSSLPSLLMTAEQPSSPVASAPPLVSTNSAIDLDPTRMVFHRLGVRRYIFSQKIPLSALIPSEVVGMASMHPSFAEGAEATLGKARPLLENGTLVLTDPDSTIYVGGVTPYALYELDVREMIGSSEAAIDLATHGLGRRVQVAVGAKGIVLRLIRDGKVEREEVYDPKPPAAPFQLRVEMTGIRVTVFLTKDGTTRFIGHTGDGEDFKKFIDFRDRRILAGSSFNVASHVATGGRIVLGGASSSLSPGMGQADIRMITHKDGAPYWENNRLWFTITCRGGLSDEDWDGVISLDPSVFDVKFEGIVVYDFGDGLLRNDGPAHILYDDDAKIWRVIAPDFGGVFNHDGRSGSRLVVGESVHDPRRGFSVIGNARQLKGIAQAHEDPCLIYDKDVGKWRLLTCCFCPGGFHTQLYESDNWDGPFAQIAGPTKEDSTGVLIQKIGDKRYVFSGGGKMPVYSYPDLKLLGNLKFDLQAHWPRDAGRGWPDVFPLPPGFPYRYMALMMDRESFENFKSPQWTYGALYLFGVYTPDITNAPYEYPIETIGH